MRPEPRRLQRAIRAVMSAMVVGTVMIAFTSLGPDLRAQTPDCLPGVQEAETGALTGFEVGTDAAASGGAFIHVPDGTANRWVPDDAYRASFCLSVDTDGRYRIGAAVGAATGTADSFFVVIDGATVGTGRWDTAISSSFTTDHVNSNQAADPVELDLAAGDHTVDVYLREDGTRLDAIWLEAVEADTTCSAGWVDAEQGIVSGFETVRDPGAHANQAIVAPEGSGSRWYPSATHRVAFCLSAHSDGVYRIEASTKATSSTSDSFFVQVDGGETITWYPAATGEYLTDFVNDYGVADPVELSLTAGDHIVEIFLREDGTYLDRIRLVERSTPRPRECRDTRAEAEAGTLVGFSVGSDAAASDGAYIHTPNGSGSNWSPSDSVMASYCFDAPAAGTYEIHAGVWADSGVNDSFWVRIDGQAPRRWNVAWHTDYGTDVVGFSGADPFRVELAAGAHTIDVMLREDGTRLDWIELVPVND